MVFNCSFSVVVIANRTIIASPTLFAFVGRGNPGIRAWQSSFCSADFYFDALFLTKAAWIASSQKACS
jgi:hypothetical protein